MRASALALVCAAAACAVTTGSGAARANGVFPTAEQIVIDPADPSHIIVRTTYGILTTRAAGEPWDWICESAAGYSSGYHPSVAVTEDGTVIAGLTNGLAVAPPETCTWGLTPGITADAHVVDVSIEKGAPAHAVAVTASGPAGPARFWTSDDNAVTWQQTGADLPAGFTPLTIDVAPSDPMRVYVSAQVGGAKGSLLVSSDRGATWQPFTVPGTNAEHLPYIAAVDPSNVDRVYIRTDGTPGKLFLYDHSAVMFTEIYSGLGVLRGFALSPDGQTLLVGGSSDGIQRASAATLQFEKVASIATRCLVWSSAGVYTCANEINDGFTIGLSHDEGATFDPVMHLPCLRGPLECDPESTVGKECPGQWAAVATQIGKDQCDAGSTGSGGASSTGSGGAAGASNGTGAGGTGTATNSAGGADAAGGSGGSGASPPGGGCTCSLDRDPPGNESLLAMVSGTALLAVLFRRGRRRATPRK